MAYPTTIDAPTTNSTPTETVAAFGHSAQHNLVASAVIALETKVGVDGSAVTTTHDYKLSEVTSSDKAVGKTATQTLTNKTLTTPTITTPVINGTITGTTVIPLANGGTGKALVDPNADRIMFWDDSAGETAYLTVGSGLDITGTTLTSTAASVITIQTGTTATTSLTTTAGQKVIVWAKATATPSTNTSTVTLAYNGVTKDTVDCHGLQGALASAACPVSLMYTETPGAATHDITLTANNSCGLANIVVIIQIIT